MKPFSNAAILLPIILVMITIMIRFEHLFSFNTEHFNKEDLRGLTFDLRDSSINNQKNVMINQMKVMLTEKPATPVCIK
jgi:hypothetical protein